MRYPGSHRSQFQHDANAGEAIANGRRYLVGVGIGKLVSAGTDVGLSPAAQSCLDVLIDLAAAHDPPPSLNLIQITPDQVTSESVRHVMQLADEGDILFFFVADARGCASVMQAINAYAAADWHAVGTDSQ